MAEFSLNLPLPPEADSNILQEAVQTELERGTETRPAASITSSSTASQSKLLTRIDELEAKLNSVLAELYGGSSSSVQNLNSTNYPFYAEPSGEGLRSIVRGTASGYSKDLELIITSHFSVLNPDLMSANELSAITEQLRIAISKQAGVGKENVLIVELEPTGSSTAQIKILYPADTIDLEAKKQSFQDFVSDQQNVSDILDPIVGPSQILAVTESRKRSVSAKLNEIERRLTTEFTLDHRSFFQLSNFKFEVQEDKLIINRFDDDQETFVGAELVLD
tara:strand:- start:1 stop:834 length:834 start_codon:yes stop_codon:yes gene_type:complete